MPARAEQKVEATEVLQAVEEDRRFVYQATIVRLMKGRKVGPCIFRSWNFADLADLEASGFDPGGYGADFCKLTYLRTGTRAKSFSLNSPRKSRKSRRQSITCLTRNTLSELKSRTIPSKLHDTRWISKLTSLATTSRKRHSDALDRDDTIDYITTWTEHEIGEDERSGQWSHCIWLRKSYSGILLCFNNCTSRLQVQSGTQGMYTSIIPGPFPSLVLCSAWRSISRWCLERSFHLYYLPADMSENKVDQQEMWKQGCRAVFAGFVASAHQRGVCYASPGTSWQVATSKYRYVLVNRTKRYSPPFAPISRSFITRWSRC